MMSSAYSQRSRQPVIEPVVEEPVEEPKKKKAPGTSNFVQVKLSQALYGPLKVIAGLSGKTAPELLEEIVTAALESYKSMTLDDFIQK